MTASEEKIMTDLELAKAVGVGRSTITLARKAARLLNDPLPHYATPSDFKKWFRTHPTFVAAQWVGERWKELGIAPNQNDARAGKSRVSSSKRAQQIPSPDAPTPQPEPVAKQPSPGSNESTDEAKSL